MLDSVNGTINFSFPAVHHGREVQDVRLKFKNGKVVDASAGKGEDFLISMLDMDAGARFLGECAIGTNFGIQRTPATRCSMKKSAAPFICCRSRLSRDRKQQ